MGTEHTQLADWGLTNAPNDLQRYSEILLLCSLSSFSLKDAFCKSIISAPDPNPISGTNPTFSRQGDNLQYFT